MIVHIPCPDFLPLTIARPERYAIANFINAAAGGRTSWPHPVVEKRVCTRGHLRALARSPPRRKKKKLVTRRFSSVPHCATVRATVDLIGASDGYGDN